MDKINIAAFGERIKDLLFPRHCPVCDSILPAGEMICRDCKCIPQKVQSPKCAKCGKHVKRTDLIYCADCGRDPKHFNRGIALYEYRSVHNSIAAFKNMGRPEYGQYYGRQIAEELKNEIKDMHADALVPVPLSFRKQKKRGFNQAQILAEEISKILNIPIENNLILRNNKTTPQKKMSREQRQNNMKKAFHIAKNDVKLKSVILVDDIYTTGNTLDAISIVLKDAGVENIYFVTIAIGSEN